MCAMALSPVLTKMCDDVGLEPERPMYVIQSCRWNISILGNQNGTR